MSLKSDWLIGMLIHELVALNEIMFRLFLYQIYKYKNACIFSDCSMHITLLYVRI